MELRDFPPAESSPEAKAFGGWLDNRPQLGKAFDQDVATHSAWWQQGLDLLSKLPAKPKRSQTEQKLAEAILDASRKKRTDFLAAHGIAVYDRLTASRSRHARVEELAYSAAALVPGLVPTKVLVEAEAQLLHKDKDGHEYDQGLLFNRFLGERETGLHLCHAMLRPRAEATELLERLTREGKIDLGTAMIERRGTASIAYMKNPRYLNAEDCTTVDNVETAVDLALLDPATDICVLRGAPITGGKYDGQNVFCTGINLTQLYQGKISYLWYLVRDLGFINKMFRGLASDVSPDEIFGDTLEKPWVAVIERYAIGGGCQYLLSSDYILAGDDAYMTLPARKEGIIPGIANLRLSRFVGDRTARQAVMYDKRLDCDSPEGRLVCDEVVPAKEIEGALANVIERLTTSGVVSTSSNRRAFRIAHEPLDLFRSYMAVYAREQAYCHFSPALIANLERFWNADKRAA
ncbi:enoyl-CoA hydratase/isomerase family protein [Bosea sp. F3-2]|uniref:enoyl-CoA hydratase/isomerase family protein n=1 Tax=Bosea sp. F3-2 TaxID=2599640 RepID=UPI0011EEC4AF|nr:enoyl-CoA hydratase/isomerase family protein [Bosea sp. F3-2]QEL22894.1 enoyl-CoA hydratase/isomerase family protein [Bosea sp. F3-2]